MINGGSWHCHVVNMDYVLCMNYGSVNVNGVLVLCEHTEHYGMYHTHSPRLFRPSLVTNFKLPLLCSGKNEALSFWREAQTQNKSHPQVKVTR
jgi:hypothetical protein